MGAYVFVCISCVCVHVCVCVLVFVWCVCVAVMYVCGVCMCVCVWLHVYGLQNLERGNGEEEERWACLSFNSHLQVSVVENCSSRNTVLY